MSFTEKAWPVFERVIADYHVTDNVDAPMPAPYPASSLEALLYRKCWIDTVQWHLEDLIRDPLIDPAEALALKRRIDKSNQDRTDLVEQIDEYFLSGVQAEPAPDAPINTETPAWAVDRLSILALKIYHMREQTEREDADEAHKARCKAKLGVLLIQHEDLSQALDTLLDDIAAGRKRMRLYKQMKMYNDPSTNPVLYGNK
ncbi:MAG: DUF4254 domain-containing protein [Bacteroidaceae bacterium]|nr:DUF4254 domain-containing protein [Bacteroidaceae bacterium]